MSENSADVALDQYLSAMEASLEAALRGSARTLLINADDVRVTAEVARVIGLIAAEAVAALRPASGEGIVQIACGANRDGGLTLEITHEPNRAGAHPGAGLSEPGLMKISTLVSQLGARMAVATADPSLRCTIVIPSNAVS
jgi:two-component sensor histidine kinase